MTTISYPQEKVNRIFEQIKKFSNYDHRVYARLYLRYLAYGERKPMAISAISNNQVKSIEKWVKRHLDA